MITTLGMFLLIATLLAPTPACNTEKISDDVFYECLAKAVAYCYMDIGNQNLAGSPTGTQNMTVNGPMGGTVVITGSNSASGSIVTEDLVFTMTNVKYIWLDTEITLNGSTTCKGSHSDNYESLSYVAGNMHITGSVEKDGDTRTLDETGTVNYNSASTHSADILGHSVSW